jgi:hypothetical protein
MMPTSGYLASTRWALPRWQALAPMERWARPARLHPAIPHRSGADQGSVAPRYRAATMLSQHPRRLQRFDLTWLLRLVEPGARSVLTSLAGAA